jgi:hypothetical protein
LHKYILFGAVVSVILSTSPAMAATGMSQVPLQAQIDKHMAEYPGGVQVSDNSISYGEGNAVLTFPRPGEKAAPAGLGTGVRTADADRLEINEPDAKNLSGCPSSWRTKWYCFYEHRDFNGRRWQFKDLNNDWATNWGFNDQTSSWVNTTSKRFYTYADGFASNGSYWTFLWGMYPGDSKSSYVGDAFNDRMSYWTTTP